MHMSEQEARTLFDPFFVRLALGIQRGDAEVKSPDDLSDFLRAKLDTRALANIRYAAILWHVRSLINSDIDPDVRWDSTTRIHLMHIRDIAVVRFKQIDQAYLSSNVATNQAVTFEDQDLPLPNMPPTVARFTVGWQTDSFGRSVQSRYLVQPNNGRSPRWVISLDEMAGKGVMSPPQRIHSAPARVRIQAKKGGVRKDARADQS